MSEATANHAGGSARVGFVWFRWGGGADPGKTHVFSREHHSSPFTAFSTQCVVDDFGNLVPAGESQ